MPLLLMGIVVLKRGNNQLLGNLIHGAKSGDRLGHTVYLADCGGLYKSSRQRVSMLAMYVANGSASFFQNTLLDINHVGIVTHGRRILDVVLENNLVEMSKSRGGSDSRFIQVGKARKVGIKSNVFVGEAEVDRYWLLDCPDVSGNKFLSKPAFAAAKSDGPQSILSIRQPISAVQFPGVASSHSKMDATMTVRAPQSTIVGAFVSKVDQMKAVRPAE
jgi:hypothetical protein